MLKSCGVLLINNMLFITYLQAKVIFCDHFCAANVEDASENGIIATEVFDKLTKNLIHKLNLYSSYLIKYKKKEGG